MAWTNPYAEENKQNNTWTEILNGIQAIGALSKADPMTALGYGIGRYAKNAINNYYDRGMMKVLDNLYGNKSQQDISKNSESAENTASNPAANTPNAAERIANDIINSPKINIDFSNQRGRSPDYSFNNIENLTPSTGQYDYRDNLPKTPGELSEVQTVANAIAQNGNAQQNQQAAQINNIVSQMQFSQTPEERYQQSYKALRDAGYSDSQAQKGAGRDAQQYAAQYSAAWNDVLRREGTNANGMITERGLEAMGRLGNTGDMTANLYGNAYDMPKVGNAFARDMLSREHAGDISLRNSLAMADINNQNAMARQEAAFRNQRELAQYRAQQAREQAILEAQIKDSVKQQGYERTIKDLVEIGKMTPQEAVLTVNGAMGRSVNSGKNGTTNDNKQESEDYKRLKDWLGDYAKNNVDMEGNWLPGKGEDDPEYVSRKQRYDNYTAEKYDTSNYPDEIRLATDLLDRGYPKEFVAEYARENFSDADAVIRDLDLSAK